MCWRLQRYTVHKWAHDFVEQLTAGTEAQGTTQRYLFHTAVLEDVVASYRSAFKRLLLLDYDGTLAPFSSDPLTATPPKALLDKLAALSAHDGTTLYVISGRDRASLDAFFGELGTMGLIAEHGAWVREPGAQWQATGPLDASWKERLRPLLQLYVDRTPGALLEEKEYALAWHYRMAEDELATLRRLELKGDLGSYTNKLNLTVLEGKDVLEVKSAAITKRAASQNLVARGSFDYILAAGGDPTDEDMFDGLPANAVTIHVGGGTTRARYFAHTVAQMHALLTRLSQSLGLVPAWAARPAADGSSVPTRRFLNSAGPIPRYPLNTREKCARSQNPVWSAICFTARPVWCSSRQA
jgi:trehalose 6-phosphate synthase/phosphatase